MNYIEDGMNKNTYNELYEKHSFNNNSKDFRNNILMGFKLFSLKYPFKKSMNSLVVLNNFFDINKIDIYKKIELYNYLKDVHYYFLSCIKYNKENNEFYFEDDQNGYKFKFKLLSDCTDNSKMRKILRSKEKFHRCHDGSMTIIPNIENSYLITGYLDSFGVNTLHTIVETNGNYIIDYTLNLYIEKDVYYRLTNFREIQRIEKKDYLNDLKIVDNKLNNKTYLTFRDEIIKDLNKNKKVLKLDKEESK